MRHPTNLVIIGASTGGTRVLPEMLRRLPRMPAAILLVQHIPEFITPSFLGTLQRASRMPVAVATDGLSLTEGAVILTPGGLHCSVMENHRLRVAPGEKVNFVIPSVDVTMQSVRVALPGQRLFGVILTGMGRDGAAGLAHLKRLGATTFAQDKATCAVHGMPAEAVRLGAVDAELPPEGIVQRLVEEILGGQKKVPTGAGGISRLVH